MGKPLRVVSPNEAPPRKASRKKPAPKKLSITEAAAKGTVRDQLVALRDRVAEAVENRACPPRDLAALSRRLMEITKEIGAIDERDAEEAGIAGAQAADAKWEPV